MIRLGAQIRLTSKEIEYFQWLTDIEPAGIRTLADLDAYVAKCKAHYVGRVARHAVPALDDRPGGCALPRGLMA